jgi:hypothetical protein
MVGLRAATVLCIAGALVFGSCASNQQSGGAGQTAGTASSSSVLGPITVASDTSPAVETNTAPPDTAPPDSTVVPSTASTVTPSVAPAPSTTLPSASPINVGDGTILGISPGSTHTAAVSRLPALADPVAGGETTFACLNVRYPNHWVSQLGTLVLVWEGQTLSDAVLTNWQYTNPDPSRSPTVVARNGVTVGSDRSSVLAAYSNAIDSGATIDANDVELRFGLTGNTVVSLGHIDCGD